MTMKISHIKNIVNTAFGHSSVYFFLSLIILFICWRLFGFFYRFYRRKKLEHFSKQIESARQLAISAISPSSNRDDYLFDNDDYRRGNSKESYYKKTFALHLLETFGNCCAKCGDKENGIDIDHFIFSKNEGGCFIMKHKDGYLINNAIPLCRTCNRSKSDNNHRTFFDDEKLLSILQRSLLMTKLLNERPIFNKNGEVLNHRRAD